MVRTMTDISQPSSPPIDSLNWPSVSDGQPSSVLAIQTTVDRIDPWLSKAGSSRFDPGLFNDTADLYDHVDRDKPWSRSDKLKVCRSGHWFVRHEESAEVRLATNACGLRWCPKCADARARYLAHNVGAWCETFDRPKFLTLTLRHNNSPLSEQVTFLYKAFRKFRLLKHFRENVFGGIWGLHVIKSVNDGLWHIHLHCLIHANYYAHANYKRMWSMVAEGSNIVDIRSIDDAVGAAYDVAGYAACPYDMSKNDTADNVTVYDALHGKRLCGTWGTAKGVPLRPGKLLDYDKWHNVGSLSVVQAFYNESPEAKAIADAWHNNTPLEAGVSVNLLDAFLDGGLSASEQEAWDTEFYHKARDPPNPAGQLF